MNRKLVSSCHLFCSDPSSLRCCSKTESPGVELEPLPQQCGTWGRVPEELWLYTWCSDPAELAGKELAWRLKPLGEAKLQQEDKHHTDSLPKASCLAISHHPSPPGDSLGPRLGLCCVTCIKHRPPPMTPSPWGPPAPCHLLLCSTKVCDPVHPLVLSTARPILVQVQGALVPCLPACVPSDLAGHR